MGTPLKPSRPKRYGWFRQYNDFVSHPKWLAVSDRTKVELCRVLAIVTCIEVAANKGRPRGSIADFSVLECAAALRIPAPEVRRVYKALEKCGWIDQEYLSTWDDRQPDKEDPTNAIRQQRHREKRRAERTASAGRNGVTAVIQTPKTTDIDKQEAAVTKISTGQTVTWGEAEAARRAQPRQRFLAFPPMPVPRR
jgi:hypothetical protein